MSTAGTADAGRQRLDLEVQQIESTRARRSLGLGGRDLWSSVALGSGFLAAAAALAALVPSTRSPSLLTAIALVALYALASRIRFEVGTGIAIPTQTVFVPMLFVLPIGYVPLCVAAALLLAGVVDHVRQGIRLQRMLLRLVNSWHAVGPVLVLAVAGERGVSLSDWPLYVVALGAQFAFDFASGGIRDYAVLGTSPLSQLRLMRRAFVVDAALAPVGLALAFTAGEWPQAFLLGLPLLGVMHSFAQERRARVDHALELSHAYRGTALLLGDVVEADDAYTGSHSRDVVSLVLAVCDQLKLGPLERRDAEFVALLHDVGKVRIPDDIINKPGALTPEEREIVNTHTIEGEQMLAKVGGLLGEIGHVVRSCHERWDGDGYPDRLAGEQIPQIARIVACCDAFSAMTTTRSYRAAMPLEEAIAEVLANAGGQFDPAVAEALVAVVELDAVERAA
jgi:HD-GYP domain-containing protein (c-di-GMP phosphodiesterase class II)